MKTVKFFAVSFIITLCAVITSCGDDDDTTNVGNEGGNGSITGTVAKVDVKKAGSLSTLISDDVKFNITDLTVNGYINGDDIRLIREMAGSDIDGDKTIGKLNKISLKDAIIVTGGGAYFISSSVTGYYSKKNTITRNMFYNCRSLRYIELPNSITLLENDVFNECIELNIVMGDGINCVKSKTFYKCSGLVSIKLSNNLTDIEQSSFEDCTNLTSIELPNALTNIGNRAFYGCAKLTSITIPKNVTSIDSDVFDKCIKLREINVDANNANYSSLDGVLFNKEQTQLLKCPECKTGEYKIPNKVVYINRNAFLNCKFLTSVLIPSSVTYIGQNFFSGSTSLTSVIIGNNVTRIEDGAFNQCTNLQEIRSFANTAPSYNKAYSFKDVNKNICNLYVPLGAYASYWLTDGWDDFVNIIEFDEAGIPIDKSPTIIVNLKTAGQLPSLINTNKKNNITQMKLTGDLNGADIKYIREMAGRDVKGAITIGKLSILDISECQIVNGGNAYYENYTTTSNEIGDYMFYQCNFTSIKLPNNTIQIGNYSLSECNKLTSIEIPNNVTNIKKEAFSYTGLTSITIPNNVLQIGELICTNCENLTSAIIGNGITHIPGLAFSGCYSLTHVTFGSGVTSISTRPFGLSKYVKVIRCLSTIPPVMNVYAFISLDKEQCKIYVPNNTSNVYRLAEGWREFKNIIEM